ncbi:nucleotide sugar dehydrogenase [Streptomyces sp. NBC_00557]|uniref:nucleotide sugar dehydrogenase n=1 Tax=Streptomyces sp. NBC_00557 TaxID=2975776 RepID=UPI002E819DA0|nr:NAD(P)-binding domain-containing protein [Streptomyces sp. NBC_00557]
MHICVLGQGYVGLPLALRAAEAGHTVTGFEPDRGRCEQLAAGSSYIEDIGSDRLQKALHSGQYLPTGDPAELKGFDFAVITVPTPLTDRTPDLSCVREAGRLLAQHVQPGATVVLESTTHPGTTREVLIPLLEEGSGLVAGVHFHVGFSPERIDPGNAQWRLENTPKIVAGLTEGCLEQVKALPARSVWPQPASPLPSPARSWPSAYPRLSPRGEEPATTEPCPPAPRPRRVKRSSTTEGCCTRLRSGRSGRRTRPSAHEARARLCMWATAWTA